eukprot:TRINITY_DN85567_c0_g1_i1.p1 TRINITY_DN85567_c0_g1~~TRINITY_DN85567_c0_g1_i1.p1  ORF type:complete len:394 (-),score=183.32 TRINITY_DN85567_c0_g1_i1:122-1303(-)
MAVRRVALIASCMVVAVAALAGCALAGTIVSDLQVGIIPNGNTVVNNGVVQAGWMTPAQTLEPQDGRLEMYFSMKQSTPPQRISYQILTGAMPAGIVDVSITEGRQNTVESGGAGAYVLFDFDCVSNGTAAIQIDVNPDGYDVFSVFINKKCSNMPPTPGFSIGTKPVNPPNIVRDGVFDETWQWPVVNGSVEWMVFYVWMANATFPATPFQLLQAGDTWANNLIMSPEATVTLDPTAQPLAPGVTPTGVNVTFNCLPNEHGPSEVVFGVQPQNGAPVFVQVVKACRQPDFPPYVPVLPGGDGWSPFGIFAFTVFLLIVGFCVFGCIYNAAFLHKRGTDVIPCIDVYRAWFDNNAPVFTPQMDYDDTSTGSSKSLASSGRAGGYGATYQSENL